MIHTCTQYVRRAGSLS